MTRLTVIALAFSAFGLLSCRDEVSLTGPDRVLSETASGPSSPGIATSSESAAAELECVGLDERRVRFTTPGFSRGDRVGLYFLYVGVPSGKATLEIVWDEEDEPERVERLSLETFVTTQSSTSLDYRGVVEHTYAGVTKPVEKRVRATLRVEGYTNDCATVRRVTVSPRPATDPDPAPSPPPVPATTMTCRTIAGPLGSNSSPGFPVFIPPGRSLISRVEYTITPPPPPGSRIDLATFDFFGSRGSGAINNAGQVSSFDFALRSSFRPVCGVRGTFNGTSCTLYWNCNP